MAVFLVLALVVFVVTAIAYYFLYGGQDAVASSVSDWYASGAYVLKTAEPCLESPAKRQPVQAISLNTAEPLKEFDTAKSSSLRTAELLEDASLKYRGLRTAEALRENGPSSTLAGLRTAEATVDTGPSKFSSLRTAEAMRDDSSAPRSSGLKTAEATREFGSGGKYQLKTAEATIDNVGKSKSWKLRTAEPTIRTAEATIRTAEATTNKGENDNFAPTQESGETPAMQAQEMAGGKKRKSKKNRNHSHGKDRTSKSRGRRSKLGENEVEDRRYGIESHVLSGGSQIDSGSSYQQL